MYICPTPSRCYDFLLSANTTVPACLFGITCCFDKLPFISTENYEKDILGTRPDPTTIILCLRPKTDYSVFNFLCSK